MIGKTNVGGGGGFVYGIIAVTYPVGSALTIETISGGSGVPSKRDYSSTQRLYYVKAAGTYRITATKDGGSSTKDVTILALGDTAKIILTYNLLLYMAGDQSGWSAKGWKYSTGTGITAASPIVTFGTESMTIQQEDYHSGITYHDKVDLTDFELLIAEGSFNGPVDNGNGLYVLPNINGSETYPTVATIYQNKSGNGLQRISIDISSLIGEYYVAIGSARSGQGVANHVITGIWAE